MNKIGHYLQEHVAGEVIASADARHYFATDNSILTVTPTLILYPRNENDVRKTARFTWQLAERNHVMPITARGAGTDQSGAAIGSGLIMAFSAHLNRIVELDAKSGLVTVEPGANYGKLQQALQTHGRFLPPYPASLEYSTIGGAVANNAGGLKSLKYGSTRDYVRSLRMVLANGEAIVTERLNKRELNKKLGLSTFEGEIYRAVDTLLEEHAATVKTMNRDGLRNAAGYDLFDVREPDGSFDLTPLIVGSQSTLALVTEVTLSTEVYNPDTVLLVASFSDVAALQLVVSELKRGRELPSAMELVDDNLLSLVASANPAQLKGVTTQPFPKFMLFVEYDDSGWAQKRNVKRAAKLLHKHASHVQTITDLDEQASFWRIRQSSATAMTQVVGTRKALPILNDSAVPSEQLQALLSGVYELFEHNHEPVAVWGHAGDASLHLQPYLDIDQIGDRQKAFRLMEEYSKLVISLGGTISTGHGDGRLRAPYLEKMYGPEAYDLLRKVKKIFDPYGTLNPGVKIDVTVDDIKLLLRHEYSLSHLYAQLPNS